MTQRGYDSGMVVMSLVLLLLSVVEGRPRRGHRPPPAPVTEEDAVVDAEEQTDSPAAEASAVLDPQGEAARGVQDVGSQGEGTETAPGPAGWPETRQTRQAQRAARLDQWEQERAARRAARQARRRAWDEARQARQQRRQGTRVAGLVEPLPAVPEVVATGEPPVPEVLAPPVPAVVPPADPGPVVPLSQGPAPTPPVVPPPDTRDIVVTPPPPAPLPPAPPMRPLLAWDPPLPGNPLPSSLELYRREDRPGTTYTVGQPLVAVPPAVTTMLDAWAQPGGQYCYVAYFTYGSQRSEPSNEVCGVGVSLLVDAPQQ